MITSLDIILWVLIGVVVLILSFIHYMTFFASKKQRDNLLWDDADSVGTIIFDVVVLIALFMIKFGL